MTILDEIPVVSLDDDKYRDVTIRAHEVMGQMMQRIPRYVRVSSWTVRHGEIDLMLGWFDGHQARALLMLVAELFNLEYDERLHSSDGTDHMVSASGRYAEVPVRAWKLVAPCDCGNCGGAR